MFTSRRSAPSGPGAGQALPERVRLGLPYRFEAVGEALASGSDPVPACETLGRSLAMDGVPLDECLADLAATFARVRRTEPTFASVQALSTAWSDATLGYIRSIACADPMTGLATPSHLRTRVGEMYRAQGAGGPSVADSAALVVVDPATARGGSDGLDASMQLARIAETARSVFGGPEVIGRVGHRRVAVVARRDDQLGRQVALLRRMIRTVDPAGRDVRVWIEGLPNTDPAFASLLDELAR